MHRWDKNSWWREQPVKGVKVRGQFKELTKVHVGQEGEGSASTARLDREGSIGETGSPWMILDDQVP